MMKRFAALIGLVTAAALLLSSCKKEQNGTFSLDTQALYLTAGETASVTFTARNIVSCSISVKPEGWDDPVIDFSGRTITVTAPTADDDAAESSGTFTVLATDKEGAHFTQKLFAGIVATEDLTGRIANSYLINHGDTHYLLDGMVRGDGSALATASVEVVWQSVSDLIEYLTFDSSRGLVSFYVANEGDAVTSGNALLGAYDAQGKLLWSWHLWVTDYDPEATDGTVTFNNVTMMTRNLGALAQSNASTGDILQSFGLFYQWGRKDPFIGPSSYNASNGTTATMYTPTGGHVYLTAEASSAETGTLEYATEHPLTFITGVEASQHDWLWGGRSDALWSESAKTVNDPCPYGWKVAPASAFAGLQIVGTPAAGDAEKYAWTLGREGAESLFFGAGRRRYDNSKVQNVYLTLPVDPASAQAQTRADDAQPWEGLYWTTTPQGDDAAAFHFWFEKKTVSGGVADAVPYARANGMSVRCVRAE